jgi:peptide/nickel transport system substrate-binding protein
LEQHKGGGDVRKHFAIVAFVAVLSLVAAACGGGDDDGEATGPTGETTATGPTSTGPTGEDLSGGILREETVDFGFTNAFDPTGEYLGSAWSLFGNFLTRGLVSYPWLPGDQGGNEPVADLATDTGQVSSDGLTWTFTLKEGVMWQAPLSRPVTSADVAFAFQRINTESLIAQYGFYYCGTIVGMDCGGADQADPIEGIETPDDQTIVFHLEQPTGDFLYRLAQPAAAPIPPEVAGCFSEAGEYGRYVMSNGPYMLLGSDELDVSSCDTLQPISGYDPDAHMYFVRNDAYDQATDDSRLNYIDGFAYTINTNVEDIYNRVLNGDIDLAHGAPPAAILQQYLTNPDLEDNLKTDPGDRTWYIYMSLIVPPFDDIHVRKAVNLVVDKAALLQATGGPTTGEVATTIEPPTVLPDTADYDPYPSPDFAGDVEAAKAEMAQSRYDSDGDGVCDDPVCENVLFVNRNYEPWTLYSPIMQESLAEIGINLRVRELDISTAYTTIQTVNNLVPIAINAGWGKDYASPYGFDFYLFNTAGIACEGNVNYSLVGVDADAAAECGDNVLAAYEAAVEANGEILSVDADMDACVATPPGPEYNACWAALDTRLMEEIVPWVPYRWGSQNTVLADSVVAWSYDQSAGWTAYSRTAVDNGLTMDEVAA